MYVERLRLTRSFTFFRSRGSDAAHDLHIHDCLEIGALLSEELEYRFGDRSFRCRPGDVFLCRPFEPHWSFALPGKPFEQIIALFTPAAVRALPDRGRLLTPFYSAAVPPVIPGGSPHASAVVRAAREAAEAAERREPAWETRQYMRLIEMLLHVDAFARELRQEAAEAPDAASRADAVGEWIGRLLEGYLEPDAVERLIRQCGVGRTAFYREFRRLTGLSPQAFVNRLRIQTAMDALRATDEPITGLAASCGFQSLSAFNKQFAAHAGCAPRAYRARFRNGPAGPRS